MKLIQLLGGILFFIISCKQPQARKPNVVKSGLGIKKSILLNQKIKERDEKLIQQIIKKDTINTYLNSGNGFWYYYVKKDSVVGIKPSFGDYVNFDYNIKDINGVTIYSKEELSNKKYQVDKEELFFGLREGLKLLQEGESVVFLFPSYLAFGFYGDLKKIGNNMPLISEVTVNSILKNIKH